MHSGKNTEIHDSETQSLLFKRGFGTQVNSQVAGKQSDRESAKAGSENTQTLEVEGDAGQVKPISGGEGDNDLAGRNHKRTGSEVV